MARSKQPFGSQIFSTLIVPLAAGLGLYLLLVLMIDRQVIANELLLRYLTGHPISQITTYMFCVAFASLLVIANNVFDQFCWCERIRLADTDLDGKQRSANGDQPASPGHLINHLQNYKRSLRGHYLWRRLYRSLQHIERSGNSVSLEEESKYLAELDRAAQQRRYSLVRIVIWATPMLGFLGTVLGISQALGGIQVGPENDFQGMLNSLRGSLFVAFDTTALALTLSILLMFFLYFLDRFESQLLETVDQRAIEDLQVVAVDNTFADPQTRIVEKIGRTLMANSHELVRQQTEIWEKSMQRAERSWADSLTGVSETVRGSLSGSLQSSTGELAEAITSAIDRADKAMAQRWEQWQVMLSDNARQMSQHQRSLVAQTEMIRSVIQKLESNGGAQQMLSRNLDALAATSRLQQTLQQLTESIGDIRRRASEPQARPRSEVPDTATRQQRKSDPAIIQFRDSVAEKNRRSSNLDIDLRPQKDAA